MQLINEVPKVVKVEAKATNFAVLLHELAKGAMEYLFAIRLSGFSNNSVIWNERRLWNLYYGNILRINWRALIIRFYG